MTAIIHFKCRACGKELEIAPSAASAMDCPHCRAAIPIFMTDAIRNRGTVDVCVSCGHEDLYLQKDFNRSTGLAIVGAGIAASIYFFATGRPIFAMASLGATALVDLLAHRLVREVTVCYACHAIYRGFNRNPEHEPFDLKKLEKYGGRTPRGTP